MDPQTNVTASHCVAFVECTQQQLTSDMRTFSPSRQEPQTRRNSGLFKEKHVVCSLFFPPGNADKIVSQLKPSYEGGQICGELVLFITEHKSRQLMDKPWSSWLSPSVDTLNFSQCYQVPSIDHQMLRLTESLTESPFSCLVPIGLLRALIAEQRSIINDLEAMGMVLVPPSGAEASAWHALRCSCGGRCQLPDDLDVVRQRQVLAHRHLLHHYQRTLTIIVERLSYHRKRGHPGIWLRRSIEKRDPELQWISLNCCVQEMTVEDPSTKECKLHLERFKYKF